MEHLPVCTARVHASAVLACPAGLPVFTLFGC
jgi:hypothetical protein